MSEFTKSERDDLRYLTEVAWPLPWCNEDEGDGTGDRVIYDKNGDSVATGLERVNAPLIVAAVNALPRLLDALDRQGRLEKALEKALEDLIWCSGAPIMAPGGDAHEGWKKGPRQTIDMLYAILDTSMKSKEEKPK